MIDVSCAVIVHDGKVLAVQRGPETDHPFQWEFPGGKIRNNETPEESIRREILEELSVEIEISEKLLPIEYDYQIKQIRLIPFVCSIKKGDIQLTEHVALQWILQNETETLNWSEADMKLIDTNSEFFR